MHKILKKTIKYTACGIGVLLLVIILFVSILYFSADMLTPDYTPKANGELVQTDSLREYAGNYLRQSNSGLWELKVSGDAFQRGEAIGKLSSDLLYYQEKVFVDQIREIVPSDNYLKFLRFFIVLFNRNLGENVPEEFRDEVYGISLSCTHEYDFIGTPYERQLNYHSAHDLGHAMQDYMLVGCSSFATWGENSADSSLIIGRNFDFYMGDKFAHNKLVSFYQPEQGYKFASVGWPGMIGVLSGMNETGLTVTINAAKSDMPTASATPISILTREILQYASTIDEAYAGDIIGLPDNGTFKIGDTLTEGEMLHFRGLPSFSPEMFKYIENADPMKQKQLAKGIDQLMDEGVAQLFVNQFNGRKIIGTVGQLQFEVIQYRLLNEYNASCRWEPVSLYKACWVESDDPAELEAFKKRKYQYMAKDREGRDVFLADSGYVLQMAQMDFKHIKFHFTSEF